MKVAGVFFLLVDHSEIEALPIALQFRAALHLPYMRKSPPSNGGLSR